MILLHLLCTMATVLPIYINGKEKRMISKTKEAAVILPVIFVLFCLLFASCTQGVKLKDVFLSAKAPYFETLSEMEETADVIIVGKKIDEAYLLYHGEYPFATMSNFRIETVQKDRTGMLKAGDTILVLENEFVYEKGKERHHVNGYTAMNTNDRYVLHLSANKNYYTPLGINYGVA